MWRLFLLALVPVLISVGVVSRASAEAPLCTLSTDFEREVLSVNAVLGAAVYDLRTGTIWSGGHSGPYALHSVVKPPIAWAVMTDAYDNDRELTKVQRDALFYMVAWSQNPDVPTLLRMIGGLSGLTEYYERWGVPELIELTHHSRWGIGQAEPVHLARLFAALAMSEAVPQAVRAEGFDLLREVVDNHRWGAMIPNRDLPGWESLIKTGNYTIPESEDADPIAKINPRSYEDTAQLLVDLQEAEQEAEEAAAAMADEVGDTPLVKSTVKKRAIVRMNSAAIWLGPSSSGSQPRYVVAIMQESYIPWTASRKLQNEIGTMLAEAIAQRETGERSQPANHCIKRALS